MNTSKNGQNNNGTDFSERRSHKRVSVLATFCIFVTEGNEIPNPESTPFVSAGLYDISLGGAQFSCESMTACSPFSDREQKITKDSTIWLVVNSSLDDSSSCCSGCCSSPKTLSADEKLTMFNDEPIQAKVMWVNKDRFGCMFTAHEEGFRKALEKIIDEILLESGIEL